MFSMNLLLTNKVVILDACKIQDEVERSHVKSILKLKDLTNNIKSWMFRGFLLTIENLFYPFWEGMFEVHIQAMLPYMCVEGL